MPKRIFWAHAVTAFLRFFLVFALMGPAAARAEHLRFCYDPYPPYALGQEGPPEGGIKVQLLEEVVSRLEGVTASVSLMPWARCHLEAVGGRMDGVLPHFPNAEREAYLAYTTGAITEEVVFWYRRDRFPDGLDWRGDPEAMAHLRLGMLRGGFVDTGLEQAFAQGAGILRVKSIDALMMVLANDRVDLVATDAAVGRYVLAQLGLENDITSIAPPITRKQSRFGLSTVTGADRHLGAFNAVLAELHRDGVIAGLLAE